MDHLSLRCGVQDVRASANDCLQLLSHTSNNPSLLLKTTLAKVPGPLFVVDILELPPHFRQLTVAMTF